MRPTRRGFGLIFFFRLRRHAQDPEVPAGRAKPQDGHDAAGQTDRHEIRGREGLSESAVVLRGGRQEDLTVAFVNRARPQGFRIGEFEFHRALISWD